MSADRIVRWWVDRYTRGLPQPVRVARRDEIASDVWEQHAGIGTRRIVDVAVISRCVRGIPADLSWRRSR